MVKLLFEESVAQDLAYPTREEQRFIVSSLEKLASYYSDAYETELRKSGALKRLDGEWEGYYRLRLRTFRAIYKRYADSLVVLVVRARQRRDLEK